MLDGIDQFPALPPFGDEGGSIRLQHAQAAFRASQGAEQHDHGLTAGAQTGDEGEAVFAAEFDIEHDDVGLQTARQFERIAAAASRPGEVKEGRLAADQRADTGKDGGLVIDKQDFDGGSSGTAHDGGIQAGGTGRDGSILALAASATHGRS